MGNETYKLEKANSMAEFDSWHIEMTSGARVIRGYLKFVYAGARSPNVFVGGTSTLRGLNELPASLQERGLRREPAELKRLAEGWRAGEQNGLVALLKDVLVNGEPIRGPGGA